MKYNRFEDLPVWKAAIEFAVKVFELTAQPDFKNHGDLKNQLERAAISISNNIAEGFERGTTNELIYFLYVSRGSAGECRSMLNLLERLPASANLKFEISNLKSLGESISRQLRGWLDSVQNSEIKGQKFLNDKVRRETEQQREHAEWRAELQAITQRNIEESRRKHEQMQAEKDKSQI
jgi:four helix bundle protein